MSAGPQVSEALLVELPGAPRTGEGLVDLHALVRALGPCDLLETAGETTGWSYVVPHDGPVLRDDGTRSVIEHLDGTREDLGTDPFVAIDRWCERLGIRPDDPRAGPGDAGDLEASASPPLAAGLVGALAYDLGRRIERLPEVTVADRDQDHLRLRLADLVVAVAPGRYTAWVAGRDLSARGGLRLRAEDLARRAQVSVPTTDRATRSVAASPETDRPPMTSLSRAAYLAGVTKVLERIAAGDVFQVNLTQRLTAHWPGDTHGLYRELRHHSPSAFGAALPDIGVASVSPETFLTADGRRVRTRPVKGTRPRAADPDLDAAHADDLATSGKDRAENVMVVDLERNDLGRVCLPGSVRVPWLCRLEAHPTVWHLVSEVAGVLGPGVGWGGLLRATFPCGSITGAPKVAAMELIERLERVPRGWYCGAVGFLAPGAVRLSVAIRTATLFDDGLVDHGVGGGIVADSDPAAEHAESLDKAAAFLRTVGATR